MKKKILTLTMITCLGLTSLTGCTLFERVTSESLTKEFINTMEDMSYAKMDLNMDMKMEISQDNESIEFSFNSINDLKYDKNEDDYIIEANSKNKVSLFGMSETTKTKQYLILEDGTLTTYSKELSDEEAEWTKSIEENNEIEMDFSNFNNIDFILEDETISYNDEECYVLNGTITGNDIDEDLFSNIEGFENFDEHKFSFDDIKMYVTIYMTKENHTPNYISISMDLKSFNRLLDSMLNKENTEYLEDFSIELTEFNIELDIDSINKRLEIEIPDEVLNASEINDLDNNIDIWEDDEFDDIIIDDVTTDDLKLDDLLSQNMDYKTSINKKENTTFLMLTNYNKEDVSYYVDAYFYKNNELVDTNSCYFDIEAETFLVESFWTDEDFDKVEYSLRKENLYQDLVGSEIDIYYSFNTNGEFFGTIENNTSNTLSFPVARYVIFDKNNEIVDCGYTYGEDDTLSPGETTTYDSYFNNTVDASKVIVYVTSTLKD